MSNARRLPLFLLALFTPIPALAWGTDGHRIVGRLAESQLTPSAKVEVARLLALAPPKYRTLPNACVWADDERKENADTGPWHYANVDPGANSFDEARDCPAPKCCVVSAIEDNLATLKDRTRPDVERLEALLFVVHFVGDIHQPLHVGYARDKGGNDIKIEFFHDRTNLHRVWDSQILRQTRVRWSDMAADLAREITPERAAAWRDSLSPTTWADESYVLTRTRVYAEIPESGVIGAEYQDANLAIVQDRLSAAGVRLAAVLNGAL